MPHLEKLHRDLEKQGLVVLGLDVGEETATVSKTANQESYTFRLLMGAEPTVSSKYFVEALPTTFVIDRSGKIVFRGLGGGDEGNLESEVQKALAKR
jgi:peroxiredoxin